MPHLDLDVFLEGADEPAGRLSRHAGRAISFRYLTDALPHALSLSLPLQ